MCRSSSSYAEFISSGRLAKDALAATSGECSASADIFHLEAPTLVEMLNEAPVHLSPSITPPLTMKGFMYSG
jgi:hypothetical protein